MSEFAGTALYYSKYRPGISSEVTAVLVGAARRNAPATRLLDLGTGTGQVAQALLTYLDDIIAVDPDAEMLALAEQNLRVTVSPGTVLRFSNSRAEDFSPPDGWAADLVTICRAFHWMDQPLVLQRLVGQTTDAGVVAVFGDSSFWAADSLWKKAVRRVIQDFLGEERRAGEGTFSHHNRPYSDILAESPFGDVEEITVPIQRVWNAESILGYLYSTSFAARPLFGGRLAEFETAVKAVLADYSDEDVFAEDNEFVIRLGRKG